MRNWDDFRAAAANWAVPAQNLAYADAEGNIGYQTPGSIPVRRGYSGKYPVPGWDSSYGWDGYIPFDALPNMLNPDSGLVVTANNAAIGEQYPYLLTDDWDYGYRAQRITDLLEQATAGTATIDGAGLSAIQLDTYSAVAADLVPRMQASVSGLDEQTAAAFALFEGWDFHADKDSAAAAYFNAFWRTLQDPLYNDELGPDARSNGGDRWWYVTDGLWDRPDDPWWDDTTTPEQESRDATIAAALTAAADELTARFGSDPAEWSWGQMHTLEVVANPFGASGVKPDGVDLQPGPGRARRRQQHRQRHRVGRVGVVRGRGRRRVILRRRADGSTGVRGELDPQLPVRDGLRRLRPVHVGAPHRRQRPHLQRPLRRPARALGDGPDASVGVHASGG